MLTTSHSTNPNLSILLGKELIKMHGSGRETYYTLTKLGKEVVEAIRNAPPEEDLDRLLLERFGVHAWLLSEEELDELRRELAST